MPPSPTQYPELSVLSASISSFAFNITASYESNISVPADCKVLDTSAWEFIPWDNPDNIVSQQLVKAVDTAVGAVCLPLLFLISVPGNILNMLVFWKQGLKERINLCLFYLSLVDFIHMLYSFLGNVDMLKPPFTEATGPVYEFILNNKLTAFRSFIWVSGFISMLIACERCLCVVSPLRSHTILKTRTTAAILAVATGVIVTGCTLVTFRWGLVCVFDPATRTTSKAIFTGAFYKKHQAFLNALTFILGSSQPLIYVIVVSMTTLVTSVKLSQMVAWREQSSSSSLTSREVALTRTLVAISVLYVVCSTPAIVTGTGILFVPEFSLNGRYYNLFRIFVRLLDLASFVNATFNFFIYCFLGSKYRETLGVLLSCKHRDVSDKS